MATEYVPSAADLPPDFGYVDGMRDPRDARIAALEAANAQMRAALTAIRDESLDKPKHWAAGVAVLCLGTLKS